jgi:hypothetical protein
MEIDAPSGWSIDRMSPNGDGWYVSFGGPDDITVYVTAVCSSDPENGLRVLGRNTDLSEMGFRDVGDEVIAYRDGESSYEVWWRQGRVLMNLTNYYDLADISDLEDIAEAVTEAVR